MKVYETKCIIKISNPNHTLCTVYNVRLRDLGHAVFSNSIRSVQKVRVQTRIHVKNQIFNSEISIY
jgi:hypothetical protein